MNKYKILPLFISFQGCPYKCIYCNQDEITGSKLMTPEIAEREIEGAIHEMTDFQVAFYGGTFTAIPKDQQMSYFNKIKPYLGKLINSIRISTRPDAIEVNHLRELKARGLSTIELGAQSMDPSVLKKSLRGHSPEDVVKSSKIIKDIGIELGIQQMVGLVGEDEESFRLSVEQICQIRPDFVRIYPTLVLKNTPLEQLYKKGGYVPLSLEEAVARASFAFGRYIREGIDVIRIGLQATDNISFEGDIVAGPFHPSFGQMAKSKFLVDSLLENLDSKSIDSIYEINGPSKMLANIIGHKGDGRKKLEEKYGKIRFVSKDKPNLIVKTADQVIDLGDDAYVFKINRITRL